MKHSVLQLPFIGRFSGEEHSIGANLVFNVGITLLVVFRLCFVGRETQDILVSIWALHAFAFVHFFNVSLCCV